jgi:DNA-binding response OmpR family regulator
MFYASLPVDFSVCPSQALLDVRPFDETYPGHVAQTHPAHDAWIRDSMAVFFESEGSCFLALETAEEGLNELARRDYDIVICDYRLPGMDGLSFFKLIRGKDSVKLLITAYGTDTLPDEARAAGVDGYLVKPLDMKAIESELRRLVQGRLAVPRGPEKPKERGNANRAH